MCIVICLHLDIEHRSIHFGSVYVCFTIHGLWVILLSVNLDMSMLFICHNFTVCTKTADSQSSNPLTSSPRSAIE